MLYCDYLCTPIGCLKIVASNKGIREVSLVKENGEANPNGHTDNAKKQLVAYFNGELRHFHVLFNLKCREFSKRIYQQMVNIPYGQVVSYKDLAIKIEKPNASRAIGQVCHHNPCLILIPCHRVVASNHDLKGFAIGLELKRYLLEFEGMSCLEGRVVV